MSNVRIGIVGIGNMGAGHANHLKSGTIKGAVLAAISDGDAEKRAWAEATYSGVAVYADSEAMLASGDVDAVIVATPHYDHPVEAQRALAQGMHVLIEKPAGVYTKQVREMNEAAAASGRVFSIVYNQRMNPLYRKLRELITDGELGEIRRTNWIITSWYRSQSYYDSGSWRATWGGEGGGVLINQCPHQLDLWQWTTGLMPVRIRAFCHFGKHRDIEVEDDVTAYVEYANGGTGVFITTTGEAPGTNRFEVTGDRGKIVIEDGRLTFWRLRESERDFNARNRETFGSPEHWKCEVPIHGTSSEHAGIVQNFVDAIRNGTALIAPGEEGIHGLTISNAMHLSTWLDDWVELPLNEDLYESELRKRIESSRYRKPEAAALSGTAPVELKGTF